MLKKIAIFTSFPVFLLMLFAFIGYRAFLSQPIAIEQPQLLTVKAGQSLYQLLDELREKRLISAPHWYKVLVKLNPDLTRIRQGTYQLTPNLLPEQLLRLLVEGKEHQFQVQFIEGDTIWQVEQKFAQQPQLVKTDWRDLALEFEHPEGAFYPDTYAFTAGTSDSEILLKAHQKLLGELMSAWRNRQPNLPLNSPYEALILASIIEKETSVSAERARIAAVFINRLNKGMKLQTDPTIIYGIGKDFDGDIKRADMRAKTPYNTYVIKGLPPTPIAMVSRASIIAAVNPIESDELFFVADGKGGHVFSKTYKQHQQALKRYLAGIE